VRFPPTINPTFSDVKNTAEKFLVPTFPGIIFWVQLPPALLVLYKVPLSPTANLVLAVGKFME